jgi:predicted transglutaminase-like cysteine proteinase
MGECRGRRGELEIRKRGAACGNGRERCPVGVLEVTQPPPGWVDFCARQPNECSGPTTAPAEVALSWEALLDLVWINTWVNETIKPLTDVEHWGVVDRWSYPEDGYPSWAVRGWRRDP